MSDRSVEQLCQAIDELGAVFNELASALQAAATELSRKGAPPEGLTADIERVVLAFDELKAELWERATAVGLTVEMASLAALRDLEDAGRMLRAHESREVADHLAGIRARALSLLEQVLSLKHKSKPDFEALGACQHRARALRNAILDAPLPSQHPDEPALADCSHPFGALVDLVTKDDLDDDSAEMLRASVADQFGNVLAMAAVRSALIVEPVQASPVSPPEPALPESSEEQEDQVSAFLPGESQASDQREGITTEPILSTVSGETSVASMEAVTPSATTVAEPAPIVVAPGPTAATSVSLLAGRLENGPDRVTLNELVWQLLSEDRADAAYQVLTYESMEASSNAAPTFAPWIIRPLLLGPKVGYPNGEVCRALRDDYAAFNEEHFAIDDPDWNHGIRFLLAAGALRAALIAPATGVATVLRDLHVNLNRTHDLFAVLTKHADRLQPLDMAALAGASSEAEWDSQRKALLAEARRWLSQSSSKTLIFVAATDVWRRWVSSNGVVGELIEAVIEADELRLAAASADCARYSDDVVFRELVKRTDRHELGRRRGEEITAKALSQLKRGFADAADLVRRAADLQAIRPGQAKDFLVKQAREIQHYIREHLGGVRDELANFERSRPSIAIRASLRFLYGALDDLENLVTPGRSLGEEPDPVDLTQSVLLKCAGLELDEQMTPTVGSMEVRTSLLAMLSAPDLTWAEAYELHSTAHDHEGTARVIERIWRNGGEDELVEKLTVRRESEIAEGRASLMRSLDWVQSQVGRAVAFGVVREAERLSLDGRLEAVRAAHSRLIRFGAARLELEAVKGELERLKAAEADRARTALEVANIGPDHQAHSRIVAALNESDFITANEFLDYVRRGETLPEPSASEGAFDRFFPEQLNAIASQSDVIGLASLPDVIKGGGTFAGLDFSAEGVNRDLTGRFVSGWLRAATEKVVDGSQVKAILNNLGFNVQELSRPSRDRRYTWFSVLEAEVVADRNRCPLPAYGSLAGGKYRVLCVWDKPSEEDLLLEVDAASQGQPVLVLYFSGLPESRRRILASLCRQRPRNVLIVDTYLIAFLAAETANRLRSFYECAIPFCGGEPFSTTAGLVAPEMFFGRERELRSILDPQGTCFIYGGRQLGKTALLRHAVRTFHNPEHGRIAMWIDLRPAGIGYNRPIEDVWSVLTSEMKRAGVLKPSVPDHATADRLSQELTKWLEDDGRRRVVLMLDESDKFLELDSLREFSESARLKNLMDRTDRRFKVVFAGLHNVQRATTQSNHPLAHFNDPICIGPLMDGGESRNARALIEQPFGVLGYRFETSDLVLRILAYTNYYPSLIQLFCAQLLKFVTGPSVRFDAKTVPPYTITSAYVESAYYSKELWKQVKDRFQWTLQLDQRYEVIAYIMALESKATPGHGLNSGYSVGWIRSQVLTFWPQGFQNSNSEEALRILADEMVGLGLLRLCPEGCYALRNANVLSLMGSESEIAAGLERDREPPAEYEAAAFRSSYRMGGHAQDERRSPLTAQQEERIRKRENEVVVVCGISAAGLEDTAKFVEMTVGEKFFVRLKDSASVDRFSSSLTDVFGSRREGVTVVYVPAQCRWDSDWVSRAASRLRGITRTKEFVKVVFEADVATVWHLVHHSDPKLLADLRSSMLTLAPWKDAAVRQWLEDANIHADPGMRSNLRQATGNWQWLLSRFLAEHKASASWDSAIQQVGASTGSDSSIAPRFGLDVEGPVEVLREFASLGEATVDDLAAVLDQRPRLMIQQAITWAELLSLVEPRQQECWRVEPIVANILLGK